VAVSLTVEVLVAVFGKDLLPRRLGLHFHREITLQMGDPGRVANVVI
jgi:hypothetical protein